MFRARGMGLVMLLPPEPLHLLITRHHLTLPHHSTTPTTPSLMAIKHLLLPTSLTTAPRPLQPSFTQLLLLLVQDKRILVQLPIMHQAIQMDPMPCRNTIVALLQVKVRVAQVITVVHPLLLVVIDDPTISWMGLSRVVPLLL